jgi:ferritin-like protein
VIQGFRIEQIPFVTTTRWIANHARCSASQHDRAMSQQLQTPQGDLPEKVPYMQRIGSWVKTYIRRNL